MPGIALKLALSRLAIDRGWPLFCRGRAAALTPILGLPDDDTLGDQFAEAAQSLRPRAG